VTFHRLAVDIAGGLLGTLIGLALVAAVVLVVWLLNEWAHGST
jgi:hypothetical protein